MFVYMLDLARNGHASDSSDYVNFPYPTPKAIDDVTEFLHRTH